MEPEYHESMAKLSRYFRRLVCGLWLSVVSYSSISVALSVSLSYYCIVLALCVSREICLVQLAHLTPHLAYSPPKCTPSTHRIATGDQQAIVRQSSKERVINSGGHLQYDRPVHSQNK